jgi:hypothetical protein
VTVYNGIEVQAPSADTGQEAYFDSSLNNGGLYVTGGDGISGSQYYTGDESAPTFITGTYTDQTSYTGSSIPATVTITDVSSVPEPAAWTLMLAGFGGLGGALRARRRQVVGD